MKKKAKIVAWYGKQEDAPIFPDLKYWQGRKTSEKFSATWDLSNRSRVVTTCKYLKCILMFIKECREDPRR